MISAVVCRKKLIEVLRIADDSVEVDNCVEVALRANPFIHRLPVGFAERAGMIVSGSEIRRDGCAVNDEAMRVRSLAGD